MVQFEEDNPDDLLGNMVILGISLIVIAAVAIGVIAGKDRSHDDDHMMTLVAVCDQTDYKDACKASLKAAGDSAEVKTYFRFAVNGTITEMAHAMKKVKVDKNMAPAVEDCMELIGLCMEELQSVITILNTAPNSSFYNDSSGDIRSSLSAVLSYHRACLEGLKETTTRSTSTSSDIMDQLLHNPTQLTSIALAIIYEYSQNDDVKADPTAAAAIPPPPASSNDDEFTPNPSTAGRKLLQSGGQMRPDAVVAKDRSGQYANITAALNAYPNGHKGRYLIYVKSGVYEENVIIAKNTTQIFMYGDGLDKTIISGSTDHHFHGRGSRTTTTYRRATLSVIGDGFICKDIGIKIPDKSRGNSMHMAAVKIQSDRAAFFNCRINGSATSNIYALANRQLFVDCEIYGVTNIIRGDAAVVIQRSRIILAPPSPPILENIIALQGRSDRRESTGFVIHGCTIERDQSYRFSPNYGVAEKGGAYLGMAVEKYSRTIVMESSLGDLIHPDGWYSNNNNSALIDTVTFGECENSGPGAGTNNRVNWKGYSVISNSSDVMRYTAGRFIQPQNWLNGTQLRFLPGLYFR